MSILLKLRSEIPDKEAPDTRRLLKLGVIVSKLEGARELLAQDILMNSNFYPEGQESPVSVQLRAMSRSSQSSRIQILQNSIYLCVIHIYPWVQKYEIYYSYLYSYIVLYFG